jgi:hypothetical protein
MIRRREKRWAGAGRPIFMKFVSSEDDAAPEPRVPAETPTAHHGRRDHHRRSGRRDHHGRRRRRGDDDGRRDHHRRSGRRDHHRRGHRRDHHSRSIHHADTKRAAVETGSASACGLCADNGERRRQHGARNGSQERPDHWLVSPLVPRMNSPPTPKKTPPTAKCPPEPMDRHERGTAARSTPESNPGFGQDHGQNMRRRRPAIRPDLHRYRRLHRIAATRVVTPRVPDNAGRFLPR